MVNVTGNYLCSEKGDLIRMFMCTCLWYEDGVENASIFSRTQIKGKGKGRILI